MLYEEIEEDMQAELAFLRLELDKKLKLLDNPDYSQSGSNQLELIEVKRKTDSIIEENYRLKQQITDLHSKLRLFHVTEEDNPIEYERFKDISTQDRIEKITQMNNKFKEQKDQALKIIVSLIGKEKIQSLKERYPTRDILDTLLEEYNNGNGNNSSCSINSLIGTTNSTPTKNKQKNSLSNPSSPYRSF